MAETLTVHLNREGAHAVETQSNFETDGSFAVVFDNHGTPTHVHLRPDETLSEVLTLEANNHYVDDSERVEVPVLEDRPEEVRGTLEVVTGYGAESAAVTVTLGRPAQVVVDESLSTPGEDADRSGGGYDPETLAIGALAAVGVLLVGAVAVVVEDTALVVLGVVAVLLALGAAVYLVQSS